MASSTRHRRNLRREREFGERAAQLARDLAAYVDAEVPEGGDRYVQLTAVTMSLTFVAGALKGQVGAMVELASAPAEALGDGELLTGEDTC